MQWCTRKRRSQKSETLSQDQKPLEFLLLDSTVFANKASDPFLSFSLIFFISFSISVAPPSVRHTHQYCSESRFRRELVVLDTMFLEFSSDPGRVVEDDGPVGGRLERTSALEDSSPPGGSDVSILLGETEPNSSMFLTTISAKPKRDHKPGA